MEAVLHNIRPKLKHLKVRTQQQYNRVFRKFLVQYGVDILNKPHLLQCTLQTMQKNGQKLHSRVFRCVLNLLYFGTVKFSLVSMKQHADASSCISTYVPLYAQRHMHAQQHTKIWYAVIIGNNAATTNRNDVRYHISIVYKVLFERQFGETCRLPADFTMQMLADSIAHHVTHRQYKPGCSPVSYQVQVVKHIRKLWKCLHLALDTPSLMQYLHVQQSVCSEHKRALDNETLYGKVLRPRMLNRRRNYFVEDEIVRIHQSYSTLPHQHAAAHALRDAVILQTLIETGLRRRAVAWLRLHEIFKTNTCSVQNAVCTPDKNGNIRMILLGPRAGELLLPYCLNLCATGRHNGWLFPSSKQAGLHIGGPMINRIVQQRCQQLQIVGVHVHAHAIRHYVIRKLVSIDNNLEQVSKWIGHKTINITYEYYWSRKTSLDMLAGMNVPWLQDTDIDVTQKSA